MVIAVLLAPRGAGASTVTRQAIANFEGKAFPLAVVTTRPGLPTDIQGKYCHPMPSGYKTYQGRREFVWETEKDGVHYGTLSSTLITAFQKPEHYWFVTLNLCPLRLLLEAAERFNGHGQSALVQIRLVYLDVGDSPTLVRRLVAKGVNQSIDWRIVEKQPRNLFEEAQRIASNFDLTVEKVDATPSPQFVFTNVMQAILHH